MTRTYEGMFLLDNEFVRGGWEPAKTAVSNLLAKHGGKTRSARRWAERKLAYPIRGRRRGTYLLTYYDIDPDSVPSLVRELDIHEHVLRYLLLRAEEVPEKELELSQAELASDFVAPEPPSDDAADPDEGKRAVEEEEDLDLDLDSND